MRSIFYAMAAGATLLPGFASAQVYVRPHLNSDGTYVGGHMRSAPNSTTTDNWSVRPNYNPYTGRQGTRNPTPSYPSTTMPSYPTQPRYNSPLPRTPRYNSTGSRIF